MNKFKKKNKINIKLFLGFILLIFFCFIFIFGSLKNKDKDQNLDYKLGIVATDGIALVSISNERKMINVLNLGNESSLKFKNILGQEKDIKIIKSVFWYGLGFFPDEILMLNSVNDWNKSSVLIDKLGFFNWIKYKIGYEKMLLKQEKMEGNLSDNEVFLSEIMVRDFSESRLNNEELRLSIFNNTSESGLASFMTKRLEWTGFSVVSTDNNNEKINKCLIVYGNKTDLNYGWKMINKIFDCEKRKDETLNENELELYFGDNLASVIKYSSYFK